MKYTLSGRQQRTFMKLIVEAATDKVVGVHMVGDDAAELIQGLSVAVKAGATKAQFDATVGIHPTAGEEFVTMRTARAETAPDPGRCRVGRWPFIHSTYSFTNPGGRRSGRWVQEEMMTAIQGAVPDGRESAVPQFERRRLVADQLARPAGAADAGLSRRRRAGRRRGAAAPLSAAGLRRRGAQAQGGAGQGGRRARPSCCRAATAPRASSTSPPTTSATPSACCCRWRSC